MIDLSSSTRLSIGFRVDAGPTIGGGHVMRCLTLADALAERGADCTFLTAEASIAAVPRLASSGHRVIEVPAATVDCIARARERAGQFDWLVVDSYTLAAADERALRTLGGRILVLDDLADRAHDCDILVDTVPERTPESYAGLVSAHAVLLLGERYVPIRSEFVQKRDAALVRRHATERPRRILVSFGLTDVGAITEQAVAALARAFPTLSFDVVLAEHSPSRAAVELIARHHQALTIHIDPSSMSSLMAAADIAVGASGSTSWERACLGLPAVVVVLADNQWGIARGFAQRGSVAAVHWDSEGPEGLVRSVSRLMSDRQAWLTMSECAASMCDGQGARRIAQALLGSRLALRRAVHDDARMLFDWRNDSVARANSRNSAPLNWNAHIGWLSELLTDSKRELFIGEMDGVPVGTVRLDYKDGECRLSWNVGPRFRGRGFGTELVRLGAQRSRAALLVAEIKASNVASCSIARSLGFRLAADRDGFQLWRKDRDDQNLAPRGGREATPPEQTAT